MQHQESDCIDLIFADPPFNLNKLYPSKIDDNLKTEKYLGWCKNWMDECIRILKPGGSFFIWNLPKMYGWTSRRYAIENTNCLITKDDLKKRIENDWWTPDSVREKKRKKV